MHLPGQHSQPPHSPLRARRCHRRCTRHATAAYARRPSPTPRRCPRVVRRRSRAPRRREAQRRGRPMRREALANVCQHAIGRELVRARMPDRAVRVRARTARDGVVQHLVQRVIERRESPRIGAAADDDARHTQCSGHVRHAGIVRDEQARMPQQRRERAERRRPARSTTLAGGNSRPMRRVSSASSRLPVRTTRKPRRAISCATTAKYSDGQRRE
jgi:hypothetical protein